MMSIHQKGLDTVAGIRSFAELCIHLYTDTANNYIWKLQFIDDVLKMLNVNVQ